MSLNDSNEHFLSGPFALTHTSMMLELRPVSTTGLKPNTGTGTCCHTACWRLHDGWNEHRYVPVAEALPPGGCWVFDCLVTQERYKLTRTRTAGHRYSIKNFCLQLP